ncbi:MAG TPA: ATP-grasp domain-containing protein [Anaerolineales bacterium]|nr:ATP-grasp domain-containing protein [Anaerolineales bacterium]
MHSSPLVLVYEYFTGGGCPPGELPRSLAAEALGMLWALLVDFRRWGAVRTLTALDARFAHNIPGLDRTTLPADFVVSIDPASQEQVFSTLLQRCDAVLIIAPETGGVLSRLTAQAEAAGVPVLGSSSASIAIAGDKSVCARLFSAAGLPAPLTFAAAFDTAAQAADKIGYPVVIKPLDGVSSAGVCLVPAPADLPRALDILRQETIHKSILLQSYIQGIHASVSLLVSAGRSLPLSLNRQRIEPGCPFEYLGGEIPLAHPAAVRAFELAQAAVALLPGLQGYIGVDMLLSGPDAWLIEINPRLTTSYVGLRQVIPLNLAHAIWDACRHKVLPSSVALDGRVEFSKDDYSSWGLEPARTLKSLSGTEAQEAHP